MSSKMAAAAADATPSTTLTMKLLVDSRPLRRRVVFAEAGKDVVDFLFSLLAMPAGTAAKLLGKESMVGSIGNLYASVEALDNAYVQPGAAKDALLCPAASLNSSFFRLPAPAPPPPATTTKSLFTCWNFNSYGTNCRSYVTDARGARCPSCGNEMTEPQCKYVAPEPGAGQAQDAAKKGFVQGAVTYTVADDLTVTPMSAISSITRLSACAVRGLGPLQEKTVQLGHKEGVEILRASLQSKTVLTDVFLGKKAPQPPPSYNVAASLNNGRKYECLTWRA